MQLEQSDRSLAIRSDLERRIREQLEQNEVTAEQLAEKLGLLPVGAEVLLAREDWSLDTAFRIAEAIGLDISIRVRDVSR